MGGRVGKEGGKGFAVVALMIGYPIRFWISLCFCEGGCWTGVWKW